jgi:hypothetical protein
VTGYRSAVLMIRHLYAVELSASADFWRFFDQSHAESARTSATPTSTEYKPAWHHSRSSSLRRAQGAANLIAIAIHTPFR